MLKGHDLPVQKPMADFQDSSLVCQRSFYPGMAVEQGPSRIAVGYVGR